MKKKIVWLQVLFLFIFSILTGLGSIKISASTFNTEVRESTVVVATYLEIPGTYGEIVGWGTGFFIGNPDENPEYLITNYHVISDFQDFGAGELVKVELDGEVMNVRVKIRVFYSSNDYEEAYVIDYNETKDIAVLKLASPTDERKAIPLCSPTDDMIGSDVYCVGYPGLSENEIISAVTSWGKTDVSVTAGTVSRFVISSGTGVKRIQTDAVIQRGNSGGPMVNGNGSVIGINTLYISNDAETSYYAVSIDEVIPMLENNNINYVMEDSPKKDGIFGNMPLMIGITVTIVVLLLIVVIVVISKKKKVQPKSSESISSALVQQGVPINIQSKKAMIRSMSIQHNGMSFVLGPAPIMIGRDAANCVIAYREGTPGVSKRHCSVSWNPDTEEFLVTDLNSSYGTFLMNGQKLQPNVPYHLKAGESFYVGENTNVLCVEVG